MLDFGLTFAITVFVLLFVFWPALLFPPDMTLYNRIKKTKIGARTLWNFPWFIYPIIWIVVYLFIACAESLHINGLSSTLTVLTPAAPVVGVTIPVLVVPDTCWLITWAFVVFNLTLNHFWAVVFFRYWNLIWALVIVIMLFLTSVIAAVFYALDGYWWSFGLYLVYVVYLIYAMIVNINWVMYAPTKKQLDASPLPESVEPQKRR